MRDVREPGACRAGCFEAAAVGPRDRDGRVSVYSQSGRIDASGELRRGELWINDAPE